jgi:integrase
MAKTPKPWFRKERQAWFVCINGQQLNLGRDKKQAHDTYHQLIRQPAERKVSPHSLPAIVDAFLEWVHTNRAPDTYEWYRYRLERFVRTYPDLQPDQLRPFHVQKWVDSYPDFTRTSRRNYLRSVKRCLDWARKQGYIDANPLEHLEIPTADRREVMVSQEEYTRLRTFIRNDAFTDLVVVTWETGCRPQESLRVEARHVDLNNDRWVFPTKESKGEQFPS